MNQLTSLTGAPKKVKGTFNCSGNKLTALECELKKVGGDFLCEENAQPFVEEEIRATKNVKGNVLA